MTRLRVREVAEAKGLDISKLSRRADLAYKTVWQLWNDPDKDVSIKTLGKLADALGVTVNDLIGPSFEEQPAKEGRPARLTA